VAFIVATLGCAAPGANRSSSGAPPPLAIQEQGSFAIGGTVVTTPGTFDPIAQAAFTATPDAKGQTLHGDHVYVFYQAQVNARPLPLAFWHSRGARGRAG